MRTRLLLLAPLLLTACGSGDAAEAGAGDVASAGSPAPPAGAATAMAEAGGSEALAELLVYKTPTCGCCTGWVEHLEANDFEVDTRDLRSLTAIKMEVGVPPAMASCHTALLQGYVIEGHVPAEAIERLLEERPQIAGLAVPGMPIGSPGMEGPNPEPYTVYAFDREGRTTEFMQIDPR